MLRKQYARYNLGLQDARDLTEGLANLEETEDITVRTVAMDEAIQMVMDGDITDALTVAALLRFGCDYGMDPL